MAAMLAAGAATAQAPPPPPADGGFDIRDHLDVELVGLFSGTAAITRQASKVAARWRQDFGRSRLVVGVDFEERTTELEIDLKSQYALECSRLLPEDDPDTPEDDTAEPRVTGGCERKKTLRAKDDPGVALDELYFNWVALDNLEVGVGLSAVGWGQFLVMSPVNFLLPQTLGADLGLDRGTLQEPQPHVSLRWSPLDRLEVEAYFFAELRIDPIIAAVEAAEFDDVSTRQAFGYLTDKRQAALRVVHRPDWGAWGVTLFDGVDHFDVHRPNQISRFCQHGSPDSPMFPACGQEGGSPAGLRINYGDCDLRAGPCPPPGSPEDPRRGEMADATAFALEFAYNLGGGWSVLAEMSRTETRTVPFSLLDFPREEGIDAAAMYVADDDEGYDPQGKQDPTNPARRLSKYSLVDAAGDFNERLDPRLRAVCDFNEALIGTHGGPGAPARMRTCRDLADPAYRAMRQNGINADDYTRTVLSVGVEKLTTADTGWSYSLQLLAILQDYGNPFHGELARLQELAGVEIDDFGSGSVFPGFYATYSHNAFGRPGNLVIGTGYFAGFAGVTALWNLNVLDNMSVQLGLEALTRLSDDDRIDAEGEGQRYQLAGGNDEIQPGINLGFSLSF